MNASHWNNNAKIARREIEFVQALFKGANEDAQNEYAETLKKFVSYKEAQLNMMEESGVIHAKIDDLLDKINELTIASGKNDKNIENIANGIYSSPLFNSGVLSQDAIIELVSSYRSMNLFQNQGDLYFFGAFIYKQIECMINYFINNIEGFANVSKDLDSIVTKPNKRYGPTTKPLGKEIISDSYNSSNFTFSNMSFQAKIKYINWYFEKKIIGKMETPFMDFNPYHFLNTARKKAFHGWFIADGDEQNRIVLLENNKGYFFGLFHKLLYDTTSYLFSVNKQVFPRKN